MVDLTAVIEHYKGLKVESISSVHDRAFGSCPPFHFTGLDHLRRNIGLFGKSVVQMLTYHPQESDINQFSLEIGDFVLVGFEKHFPAYLDEMHIARPDKGLFSTINTLKKDILSAREVTLYSVKLVNYERGFGDWYTSLTLSFLTYCQHL